jgi:polyribonucleotide nucleotidyltransferase
MTNKNNFEEKSFKIEVGGKELTASFNNLAEKANGEAMVRYGDTVVYAVATMSNEEMHRGFVPLSVNYEERFYSAGKISGPRFTRREGKPSDRAVLVSRMIDRGIRPMFPKSTNKEIQVIITCLSLDRENDPAVLGMIAASLALHTSDIPWNGPLGAVRVGKNKGEYVVNPEYEERTEKKMDLVVSGFVDENKELLVNMIEGKFGEEDEESVVKAFDVAETPIKEICDFQEEVRKEIGKEKNEFSFFEDEEAKKEIDEKSKEKIEKIFDSEDLNYEEEVKKLKEEVSAFIEEKYEKPEEVEYAFSCFQKNVKQKIRSNILEKEKRVDGRKVDELREITCSVGILPRTHGSSLFQRGQTKSLSIITLGAPGEHQVMDDMSMFEKKKFIHHYNFPPYSVGEVRPVRFPGRREIGHGMLGENAILPLIPDEETFPYTIRAVSELVSSNGSTSMAATCAVTLALMDAGVPIKSPVAGISIGLVTGEERENYKTLVDIQGIEDHYGDMDFKVTGSEKGLTAIQLDVKIDGITKKIVKEAIFLAKKTYTYIINEKIKKVIEKPREELSPFAPKIVTVLINPEKIGEVIGPKGKTINKITEETGVAIDIDDSGLISVSSENQESIEKAVEWIKNITREAKKGEIFQGKVVKLFAFGAVVEIFPGQEGLVHISEIADRRIEKVEDVLKMGQTVTVKVINVEQGKVSLSIKQAMETRETTQN